MWGALTRGKPWIGRNAGASWSTMMMRMLGFEPGMRVWRSYGEVKPCRRAARKSRLDPT